MTKNADKSNVLDAYDIYLADLISEIEHNLVQEQEYKVALEKRRLIPERNVARQESVQGVCAKELMKPKPEPVAPIPPIFLSLPADTQQNIDRAVKTYCRFLREIEEEELRRVASTLYSTADAAAERKVTMAYNMAIAERKIEDTLQNRALYTVTQAHIEQNLNAGVLVAEGKEESDYLEFFALALMQLGILYRKIQCTEMLEKNVDVAEIRESLLQGQNLLRLHRLISSTENKKRQDTKKGGKAKAAKEFTEAKEIFRKRYDVISQVNSGLTNPQIATKIYDEIVTENHDSQTKIIIPAFSTFETWARKRTKTCQSEPSQ